MNIIITQKKQRQLHSYHFTFHFLHDHKKHVIVLYTTPDIFQGFSEAKWYDYAK